MTWFKVDDSFYRSRKVRRLGRNRVAAVGLWTLCGGWSADNLTDGFVPWEVVDNWDPPHRIATKLIDVDLWHEAESDGEHGVVFHDWADWQPTRLQVTQRRKADAERRARWREAKRNGQQPDGDTGSETRDEPPESRGVSRRDAHRESRAGSALPDPTRPDPTRPVTTYGDLGGGAADSNADEPPAPRRPRCRNHRHLAADDPGPACVGCRDARLAAERHTAEQATQQRHARAAAAQAGRDCPRCDEAGWLLGDDGTPVEPAVRCDHAPGLRVVTG